MAPRCGCGSSGACNCLIVSGDVATLTVTGTGSSGNPYVITALGGGGSSCYTPAMTRVAAIALRTAGLLVVGCPVLITDGPVIGVAGSTSATTVLIWPVSATEFGQDAQVNTTFDNEGWKAQYDIDSGGDITMLEDNRGNVVWQDPGDTIIETQFPWGFSNVAGNWVSARGTSVTLTGWGTAANNGCQVASNKIWGGGLEAPLSPIAPTIVDLTGMTGGSTTRFYGNEIRTGQFKITTPTIVGADFSNNIVRDGFRLLIAPTGTAGLYQYVNGCEFRNHPPLSVVDDLSYTGSDVILFLDASEFVGGVGNPITLAGASLAGGVSIFASKIAGALSRDAVSTNDLSISNSDVSAGLFNVHGTANVLVNNSSIGGNTTINRTSGCPSALTINGSKLNATQLSQQSPTAGGEVRFTNSQLNDNQVSQPFPGGIAIESSVVNGGHIQNGSSSGRGLTLLSCLFNEAFIEQHSTVDTDTTGDQIARTDISQGFIVITGAAGTAGFFQPVDRSTIKHESTLTLTNITGAFQNSDLVSGSQLFLSNGSANLCRFSCGANVTGGAFILNEVIVDGLFTKVATANNTNTLTNKSFDDFV